MKHFDAHKRLLYRKEYYLLIYIMPSSIKSIIEEQLPVAMLINRVREGVIDINEVKREPR